MGKHMKQQDRTKNIIIVIFFLVFLGFFGLGYIVYPDRDFSEMENRYLEELPSFTWKDFLSGDFAERFEKYTADQIIGKDFFVKSQVAYKRVLGISEINQVYFAENGYLIQDYQEPGEVFSDNLEYICEFANENPEVDMTFLIIPNASEIYPEYLPEFAETYSQSEVIDTMKERLTKSNVKMVDATDTLLQHKDEDIYYKTDHHFTSLGAYYTYQTLCGEMGIQPHDKSFYGIENIEEPFLGSLYSKAPAFHQMSDCMELFKNNSGEYSVEYVNENRTEPSMYNMEYATRKDKYAVFFGGNYALTVINSNSDNQEKILVIKDSYANSVVPFLADHYDEVHMMDLRYYHDDVNAYIEENDIQKVIFIHNVDFISTDNCFLWL